MPAALLALKEVVVRVNVRVNIAVGQTTVGHVSRVLYAVLRLIRVKSATQLGLNKDCFPTQIKFFKSYVLRDLQTIC